MGLLMASFGLPSSPPPANGVQSPLGRFSDWITAAVILCSIAFALLSHVGAFGWHGDALIDLFATIAVGAVLGRAGGLAAGRDSTIAAMGEAVNTNTRALVARAELNTASAEAAHRRLDAINAPAAPLDHTGLVAGDPKNGVTA